MEAAIAGVQYRKAHVLCMPDSKSTIHSGVPRNFVRVGGSTNSVEDRENGDLGAVAH